MKGNMRHMRGLWTFALGAMVAAGIAAPAMAASEPDTRLVECRAGSCLLVSGHRDDAASAVVINGHPVPVEGARRWRAVVPVDTLRLWSAPYARTITVSVADTEAEVSLPIGLLGHAKDLAMLVVRVK